MQSSNNNPNRPVVLPENRSALLAVQEVIGSLGWRRPVAGLNPLYLHGPAGTGKTRLVATLIEQTTQQRPDLIVTLFPARELTPPTWEETEDEAIDEEAASTPAWWRSARQSDLVVIEDLQHLPMRSALLLAGLIDRLPSRGQQLVVTANMGPAQLRQRQERFPSRLTSRLAAGVVVGLEPPGPESRLILLRHFAQQQQVQVSEEVLSFLAVHLASIRQLQGAVQQVQTLIDVYNNSLGVAEVARHLNLPADQPKRITVEQVAQRVSDYFRVERRQLQSRRRFRHVLVPRQVGMYLARQLTGLSLEEIGAYFGGRDHSTVLHACRKIEEALTSDAVLSGVVRSLQAEIRKV